LRKYSDESDVAWLSPFEFLVERSALGAKMAGRRKCQDYRSRILAQSIPGKETFVPGCSALLLFVLIEGCDAEDVAAATVCLGVKKYFFARTAQRTIEVTITAILARISTFLITARSFHGIEFRAAGI